MAFLTCSNGVLLGLLFGGGHVCFLLCSIFYFKSEMGDLKFV